MLHFLRRGAAQSYPHQPFQCDSADRAYFAEPDGLREVNENRGCLALHKRPIKAQKGCCGGGRHSRHGLWQGAAGGKKASCLLACPRSLTSRSLLNGAISGTGSGLGGGGAVALWVQ